MSRNMKKYAASLDEPMQEKTLSYVNSIGREDWELLFARASVACKRPDERKQPVISGAADADNVSDLKTPSPKRYYPRFWRSVTVRLIEQDKKKRCAKSLGISE